jgi:hypothetical protein
MLLDAAEKRGFDRFVATIAADNSIIRRLLNRFSRVVTSHTSLGVSELVFARRRSWESAVPDRLSRRIASRAAKTQDEPVAGCFRLAKSLGRSR